MRQTNYNLKLHSKELVEIECTRCSQTVSGSRDEYNEWSRCCHFKEFEHNPFKMNCPNCGVRYSQRLSKKQADLRLQQEFHKFGTAVKDILKHAGQVDPEELNSCIDFIIASKEEREGTDSLSLPEKHVRTIRSMIGQVNNGGFDQFFFNCSLDTIKIISSALTTIGSNDYFDITKRAICLFDVSKLSSLPDKENHYNLITNEGENDLWEDLDSEFYRSDEDIEKMLIDYIGQNINQFE